MKKFLSIGFLFTVIILAFALCLTASGGMPTCVFQVMSDGTNFWAVSETYTNLLFSKTNMVRACCAATNTGPFAQFSVVSNATPVAGDLLQHDSTRWVPGPLNLLPLTEVTGAYTALVTDCVIICKPTASQTIALPPVASNTDRWYRFKSVTTNTVTIDGNGAETIDGAATLVINTKYDSVDIICDGDEWHKL